MPDEQVEEQLMRFDDNLSHYVVTPKNPMVRVQLHLVEEEMQAFPCK